MQSHQFNLTDVNKSCPSITFSGVVKNSPCCMISGYRHHFTFSTSSSSTWRTSPLCSSLMAILLVSVPLVPSSPSADEGSNEAEQNPPLCINQTFSWPKPPAAATCSSERACGKIAMININKDRKKTSRKFLLRSESFEVSKCYEIKLWF